MEKNNNLRQLLAAITQTLIIYIFFVTMLLFFSAFLLFPVSGILSWLSGFLFPDFSNSSTLQAELRPASLRAIILTVLSSNSFF